MAEVAISCEGVWKSFRIYHQRSNTIKERLLTRANHYEEFWALRDIDLEVPVGATLGIIGSNGSGKSTLLKTMARILSPNKGRVRVNGMISALLELGIGFHPELTGRENVYLNGSLLGQTHRDVDARYDDIVEFAGIGDFMDMPTKNYSSGMYARLAFAAAVSVDPEILLVDEVLSVGDEEFQMRCYERIAEFRSQGRTIVLVSHSLESIRSLCSQAVWIDGGVMKETGEANEVVARYLADIHGSPDHQQHPESHMPVERFGSGEAVITGVRFLDGDGEPVGTLRTGDPLTISIDYHATEPLRGMCTVAVKRAESLVAVIGRDTRDVGRDLVLEGDGTIEMTMPRCPLLKGSYLVSVVLHDQVLKKVFDWHYLRYSFMVFDDPDGPIATGLVHVDATWRMSGRNEASSALQGAPLANVGDRPTDSLRRTS